MQKYNLNDLVAFDKSKINPRILINEPEYRMVHISICAGQSTPEHSATGAVTVYALRGHITFHENNTSCELRAGEVISVEAGAAHRIVAHEDSILLALATGNGKAAAERTEELDLRAVPPPQRHPLIFGKFDALAVGDSFQLLNDHDPVPLNRQFDAYRSGQAQWEYIVRGPELFRIRIRRIAPPSTPAYS